MKEGKLRKSRSAARGWATRSAKALELLLDNPEVTRVELQGAVDEFDRRLATLDEVQSTLELEISEPSELEKDIEYADQFRRQVRAPRVQATQRLLDPEKTRTPSESGSSVDSLRLSNVRFPKLELPKFSGDIIEWQSFWDRFVALVDENDMPNISKFCYLQSLLEGEAKSVIQGLSQTSDNYPVACKMLKARFGRSERIIFAHIQALLNISLPVKTSNSKYVSSLWKLQVDLLTHVRSLETLGVSGDQYGVFMTPVILSRLPQDIRLKWSREGSGHENDLARLLTFLQKEIERRGRSEAFKDMNTGKKDNHAGGSEKRNKFQSTASALQTSSEVSAHKCGFCDKGHKSEKCYGILKLSHAEREDAIRTAKLCFRCLGKGNFSKGCKAKCVKCKGKHNVLCCTGNKGDVGLQNKGQNISNSTAGKVGDDNSNNENVSQVDASLCKFKPNTNVNVLTQSISVLQTAQVKVCAKGGIYGATLVFDTGSDRSYVSSDFIKRLKPKWVSTECISFSSFGDGKAKRGNQCNIYDMNLLDCNGKGHSLIAAKVSKICAP